MSFTMTGRREQTRRGMPWRRQVLRAVCVFADFSSRIRFPCFLSFFPPFFFRPVHPGWCRHLCSPFFCHAVRCQRSFSFSGRFYRLGLTTPLSCANSQNRGARSYLLRQRLLVMVVAVAGSIYVIVGSRYSVVCRARVVAFDFYPPVPWRNIEAAWVSFSSMWLFRGVGGNKTSVFYPINQQCVTWSISATARQAFWCL